MKRALGPGEFGRQDHQPEQDQGDAGSRQHEQHDPGQDDRSARDCDTQPANRMRESPPAGAQQRGSRKRGSGHGRGNRRHRLSVERSRGACHASPCVRQHMLQLAQGLSPPTAVGLGAGRFRAVMTTAQISGYSPCCGKDDRRRPPGQAERQTLIWQPRRGQVPPVSGPSANRSMSSPIEWSDSAGCRNG